MSRWEVIRLLLWPLSLPARYRFAFWTSIAGTALASALAPNYPGPWHFPVVIGVILGGSFLGRWLGLVICAISPDAAAAIGRYVPLAWASLAVGFMLWGILRALLMGEMVALAISLGIAATPTVLARRTRIAKALAVSDLVFAFICLGILAQTRNPMAGLSAFVPALLSGYLFAGESQAEKARLPTAPQG